MGAEQQIRSLEARRAVAMVAADVGALDDIFAPEMTHCHSNGVVDTRAEYLDSLASGRRRYTSVEFGKTEIRLYGEVAVVTGPCLVAGAGPGLPTRQLRMTTVYVCVNGRWQLAAFQATRLP